MKNILFISFLLFCSLEIRAQEHYKLYDPKAKADTLKLYPDKSSCEGCITRTEYALILLDSANKLIQESQRLSEEALLWDSMAQNCRSAALLVSNKHFKRMLQRTDTVYSTISEKLWRGAFKKLDQSNLLMDMVDSLTVPQEKLRLLPTFLNSSKHSIYPWTPPNFQLDAYWYYAVLPVSGY